MHLPPLIVVSPIERLGAIVDGVRKTLRMATLRDVEDSLENRLAVSMSVGL